MAAPGSCTICVSLHSRLAGAAATRAQGMVSQGALSSPASANSSTSRAHGPELRFIASVSAALTTLTQKTPVSRILATLSLVPSRSGFTEVEANITCGGT